MEIISSLSRAAVEGRTLCDVNALMTAFTSFVRVLCFPPILSVDDASQNVDLDWAGMIKSLTSLIDLALTHPLLKLLIAILLSCPATTNPHAVTGFWQEWSNPCTS